MTKTTITFQHTGHFWNDLGVIALWRWLVENAPVVQKGADGSYIASYEDVKCTLRVDCLEVSGDQSATHELLSKAVEELRSSVEHPTRKSKKGEPVLTPFGRTLYAGQWTPNFLAPYDELPSKGQWRRTGKCRVCGVQGKPVRTIATCYNPLLVSMDKMSGFYSELRGRYEICQSCAFAAAFALSEVWFSYGDNQLLNLMWTVGSDLLTVDHFSRLTSDLRLQGDSTHNYAHAFAYASSPTGCFLDLACSLWDMYRTRSAPSEVMIAFSNVQFHAMQLELVTKAPIVRRYEVIPDPTGVLRLVQACDWKSNGKIWNVLVRVLSDMPVQRRGQDKPDTSLLNQITDAIVTRAPIEGALERRIYEALEQLRTDAALLEYFNVLAFRLFVPIYFKEVRDMTTDLLPALQSVGETLGELVKNTDDRSVLYNLRNSRNVDDLLEVLSRVVVRHADAFVEGKPELWRNRVRELTESIDRGNWRRVRSLLGLYAGLKFIELSRREQGKESASSKS